ncbi:MAG: hypothetical protein PWQ20_1358 [Thermotogaceae bacterium]|nr:hypothetical protein [Thermotogaceae bacterium]
MRKTSFVLIFFLFVFAVLFSQTEVFISSGFKALESNSGFFISAEPVFKFWQLSASFNLNLMLGSPERLYTLDVLEKNLSEIFESASFKLWDLRYDFSNHKMKIFESYLIPLESFYLGKLSTFSVVHSDYFFLNMIDQKNHFLLISNVKYPSFSVDIKGSVLKNSENMNLEISSKIPIDFFEMIPSLRLSGNSLSGGGLALKYINGDFSTFMGFSLFPVNMVEVESGFSNVESKSLLNFGFKSEYFGSYLGITEKSVSLAGFTNFENEKISIYFEPTLIAFKNNEKVEIEPAFFSLLNFSINENWKLEMSFKVSSENPALSLGVKYKIYEEIEEAK